MKTSTTMRRAFGCAALTVTLACLTTACSHDDSTGSSTGASARGYTIWDPYPQFDGSSDWVKLLTKCGTGAGVTV